VSRCPCGGRIDCFGDCERVFAPDPVCETCRDGFEAGEPVIAYIGLNFHEGCLMADVLAGVKDDGCGYFVGALAGACAS
jgi:hypothetical protein